MQKVSCDSSNEIEFERCLWAGVGMTLGTELGFFSKAAGNAHFGGVFEIGDWRSDIMKERS